MPLVLAPDTISRDLKEFGTQLKEAIDAGHISGVVFGATLRGRRYIVNVAGTLAKDPTLARGVAAAIDDELARMVQEKKDSETTMG